MKPTKKELEEFVEYFIDDSVKKMSDEEIEEFLQNPDSWQYGMADMYLVDDGRARQFYVGDYWETVRDMLIEKLS